MKLIDIANRIDKSSKNEEWVDIGDLGSELGVDIDYAEQDRIKSYWVGNWHCTDTYVGYRMYFLDDTPVAFSIQSGRKSDESFKWFSLESVNKVKDYLLTLISENNEINVNVCDINEDIGNSFKIQYNGDILNPDKAKLNGDKVEILERIKNKPYGIDTELKVKLQNGEVKHVDVRDLDFEFHVI